jgi:ABC-type glutathione transport system ATPase component
MARVSLISALDMPCAISLSTSVSRLVRMPKATGEQVLAPGSSPCRMSSPGETTRLWPGWQGNDGRPSQVMVAAEDIRRTFGSGHTAVHALRGVSFTVGRGQLVAPRGRSGSGKTTLLNIIGGLDTPTAGAVWVAGRSLGAMTAKQRLAYRRTAVGFIWQQTSRNLLPYMTARQNVLLPMRLSSHGRRKQRDDTAHGHRRAGHHHAART